MYKCILIDKYFTHLLKLWQMNWFIIRTMRDITQIFHWFDFDLDLDFDY